MSVHYVCVDILLNLSCILGYHIVAIRSINVALAFRPCLQISQQDGNILIRVYYTLQTYQTFQVEGGCGHVTGQHVVM